MRQRFRQLLKALDLGRSEAIVLVGLGLIAVGCWQMFQPAAYLVPGLICVWYGLPSRPNFIDKKGGR